MVAHDRQSGSFATGVALTASGGGLAFIGGFLGLFGSAADAPGLAVAGWVTAGVGAALALPGIYLIVESGSQTEIYSDRGQLALHRPPRRDPVGTRRLAVRVAF